MSRPDRRPNRQQREWLVYALEAVDRWARVAQTPGATGATLRDFDDPETVAVYVTETKRLLNSARNPKEDRSMAVTPIPTDVDIAADAIRLRMIALDLEGVARPPDSSTTSSRTGAMARHGPYHAAQKSIVSPTPSSRLGLIVGAD